MGDAIAVEIGNTLDKLLEEAETILLLVVPFQPALGDEAEQIDILFRTEL